jgi:hypothetical protein
MPISTRKRFAIFERDQFACQYCGKKPPEVVLEVDHMISKKDGGDDNEMNLITACFACNRGKSATSVSIDRVKGGALRRELELLAEQKKQMKAYYRDLREKDEIVELTIDRLCGHWEKCSGGEYVLFDRGRLSLRNLLKTCTPEMITEAIEISWDKDYVRPDNKFQYMCGVLKHMRKQREALYTSET